LYFRILMKMILKHLFFTILVLFAANASGQSVSNPLPFSDLPTVIIDKPIVKQASFRYSFKNFDINEGLQSSYVTFLHQDERGWIWFGTLGAGAGKFDGKKFTFYSTKDGFGGAEVQQIISDKKGNLWFATPETGVTKYDGRNFTVYDTIKGLCSCNIWYILEQNNDDFWFGSKDEGISILHEGKISDFPYNDSLGLGISLLYIDKSQKTWICTESNGVFVWDGKKMERFNIPCSYQAKIQSITEDSSGKYYFGSYGQGIFVYDGKNFINYSDDNGILNPNIDKLVFDNDGLLWIGTSGGGIFIYENGKITPVKKNEGLTNDVVLDLLPLKNGQVWISTYGGGLTRFNGKIFTHFTTDEGLGGNVIRAIAQDVTGKLIFGSSGGGLSFFKDSVFENYSFEQRLSSKFIMSFANHKDYGFVIGTSGSGISILKDDKVTYLTGREGLGNNYILSQLVDKNGNLWIGVYGRGVFRYDGNYISFFGKKDGFYGEIVNDMLEDKNGNIWFATENAGVIKYDGKKFTSINKDNGLTNNLIYDIFEDRNGKIWIASFGGGAYCIKNGNLLKIPSDFLPDDYIASVTEDKKGNIWLGTRRGLVKLINLNNSKEFQESLLPVFENYKIKSYAINEGFTGNNCLAHSVFEDNSGCIWFGTGKHLTRYNPKYDITEVSDLNLMLNSVDLSIEKTNWAKTDRNTITYDDLAKWTGVPENLVLPWDVNKLIFSFSAVSLNAPEKIRYSYILHGLEAEWSPLSDNTQAVYSNLPPGKYTFEAYAVNEDGFKSKNTINYSFEVLPPWWQTLWFRITAIVISVVFLYLFIRIRERKLKKDKVRLEKIVQERTVEIQQKNENLKQANEEITAQRDEIESQRDTVIQQKGFIEEMLHEVNQSIKYATRLQTAILPEKTILDENLQENFVFFKPRDKVSGDFYWWAHVEGHTVIAVADCTGHGVPGAFMSMLGVSFLREIVGKEYITHPGVILRRLRKEVIKALKQKSQTDEGVNQNEISVKDGMDMTLISIDHGSGTILFSGANNPIYYIRNGLITKDSLTSDAGIDIEGVVSSSISREGSEKYLCEIKGDKMPIAIYEKMDNFSTYKISVKKGDQIYMFSDGFADQFGGAGGKKFKYKPFKQLLLENCEKPMDEQILAIEKTFIEWVGIHEQTDDVLVVGVKI